MRFSVRAKIQSLINTSSQVKWYQYQEYTNVIHAALRQSQQQTKGTLYLLLLDVRNMDSLGNVLPEMSAGG